MSHVSVSASSIYCILPVVLPKSLLYCGSRHQTASLDRTAVRNGTKKLRKEIYQSRPSNVTARPYETVFVGRGGRTLSAWRKAPLSKAQILLEVPAD